MAEVSRKSGKALGRKAGWARWFIQRGYSGDSESTGSIAGCSSATRNEESQPILGGFGNLHAHTGSAINRRGNANDDGDTSMARVRAMARR